MYNLSRVISALFLLFFPLPILGLYPQGIIINEILPSPKGPDAENEWFEIFNQNNFRVNLGGWQIRDIKGKVKTYNFPENTFINPQEFLVLQRPITKITLNNEGDGLNLIQPDGKIIDSVNYQKAPLNQSFNRLNSGWEWSSILTPGKKNIISFLVQKEEIKKENLKEKRMATIEKSLPSIQSKIKPSFLFFIALIVAIFSGIIILFLKKKIEINYNKKYERS